MSTRAIHCFLCRKVWEVYFNLGLMIIPCGDVKETRNGRSIEQDSFTTGLQGQNVFTLVTG